MPTAITDMKGNLKGSKLKDKSIPSKNEKEQIISFLLLKKTFEFIYYYMIFILTDFIFIGSASLISKVTPDLCLIISPL